MENKNRHGCVTAWLILMIVANALVAVLYLFFASAIAETLPEGVSTPMLMLLGVIGVANVVFAVSLFKWKKWAFWGFAGTSVAAFAINLMIGLTVFQAVLGFVSIALLYGILQIKRDGISAWSNLE